MGSVAKRLAAAQVILPANKGLSTRRSVTALRSNAFYPANSPVGKALRAGRLKALLPFPLRPELVYSIERLLDDLCALANG